MRDIERQRLRERERGKGERESERAWRISVSCKLGLEEEGDSNVIYSCEGFSKNGNKLFYLFGFGIESINYNVSILLLPKMVVMCFYVNLNKVSENLILIHCV